MKPPKSRKQRGSGTTNRGFFTRKTSNTSPSFETLLNYTDRIFLFLYSRINPDKANAFLQTKGETLRYIPVNPSQKKITADQKKVLDLLINSIFTPGATNASELFADKFLNTDLQTFDKELVDYEAKGQTLYNTYKQKVVTAETFAGSLDRLAPLIQKNERNLVYYSNWSDSLCGFRPEMLNNSFATFQSDFCIVVLTPTLEAKQAALTKFSSMANWKKRDFPMNYPQLTVRAQYMPKLTTKRADHLFMKASYFPTTSWIIDAFQNDAVLDMNPTLAELVKKEAFDLWNSSFWFTVYKLSGIESVDYQREKYIITDNSVFPTKKLFANLNFFVEGTHEDKKYNLLMNLLKAKKIYGFDPVTSLYLRKYRTLDWVNITNDPNITTFFKLPFVQQMLLCKLLHTAYLKIAFGTMCGPIENNTIVNNSNETPSRKAALLEAMKVYSWDLSDPAVSEELLNYVDEPEHIGAYASVLQKF